MRLSSLSRSIVGIAALAAAVPFLLWSRLESATQFNTTRRIEDIEYIPAPAALPILSIGYGPALADLLWTSALIYFGNQLAERGQLRYLEARTDAILALDPKFREVYKWIAVVAVYNNGAITRSDIETSNRYLERALRVFPRDGELRYLLAFNYAVELPPWATDDAEKRRFKRKAAQLFLEASRHPGAPADAPLMAAEMSQRSNDKAVAIAHVRSLLAVAGEDRIRNQLLARLAQLTSQDEAARADDDRREFNRVWRRDYPYLPPVMFSLVGPRLAEPVPALAVEPPEPDPEDAGPSGR